VNSYQWNIQTNGDNGQPSFDLTRSNIFNFALYIPGDKNALIGSSYFNLTNSTVNAQGQVISTASQTTATSSATSQSKTSSTSQSTSSSSTSSSQSSGLSISDKIGIGIGVGIGVPLTLAALAGVFLFARHMRNNHNYAHAVQPKEIGGTDVTSMASPHQPGRTLELQG